MTLILISWLAIGIAGIGWLWWSCAHAKSDKELFR